MTTLPVRNLLKYFMIIAAKCLNALNHTEVRNIYLNIFPLLTRIFSKLMVCEEPNSLNEASYFSIISLFNVTQN